jgi:hypothetical protein
MPTFSSRQRGGSSIGACLENLRFHDLRHEALSRFFEMGLTTPEVSGHRDIRMLMGYTPAFLKWVLGSRARSLKTSLAWRRS